MMKAKRNQDYFIPRKSWQIKSWTRWMVSSCCCSQGAGGRGPGELGPGTACPRRSTPPVRCHAPCPALLSLHPHFLKGPSWDPPSLRTRAGENHPPPSLKSPSIVPETCSKRLTKIESLQKVSDFLNAFGQKQKCVGADETVSTFHSGGPHTQEEMFKGTEAEMCGCLSAHT